MHHKNNRKKAPTFLFCLGSFFVGFFLFLGADWRIDWRIENIKTLKDYSLKAFRGGGEENRTPTDKYIYNQKPLKIGALRGVVWLSCGCVSFMVGVFSWRFSDILAHKKCARSGAHQKMIFLY